MPVCAECGMPVDKATTYHPYAACLMFKACQNSDVVQANLDAVVFHGMQPVSKDAMRYWAIRDGSCDVVDMCGSLMVTGNDVHERCYTSSEFDAAIDAAIKTPNG